MAAATSSGAGSHLQISVEPAQSSFFAGEEFACTITFTNTRVPVPQTQPLPARSTFDVVAGGDAPRSFSTSIAHQNGPTSTLDPRSNANGGSGNGTAHLHLSALPSSRRFHRKSQSVDIRTFARRNQLVRGQADDDASDENYYRTLGQHNGSEDELASSEARELVERLPSRRKLIGKDIGGQAAAIGSMNTTPKQLISTPPMKRHNKAFSVAVPGQHPLHSYNLGIGHPQGSHAFSSPRIPSDHVNIDALTASPSSLRTPSSASRRTSDKIGPSHPHSRKKSVAQVQAEDLSATFELDSNGHTGEDSPSTPSSALTTPRASMDMRNRHGSDGFYGLGENSTMESVLREDITQYSRKTPNGMPLSPTSEQHMPASSPLFNGQDTTPGAETILWAFAQFGGQFQVNESLIKPGEFEQVKQRLAGMNGISLATLPGSAGNDIPAPIGGGELGAVAEGADADDSSSSAGWGSYLRNVLSTGGGSKKASFNASHRRTGSTLLDNRQKTMASRSIPVLSNPPSMVAVDLELAPGESKSYTFRVPLPADVPPSYMGRAISFSYTLTLGTNRLYRNKRGSIEQKSRLVRIPMRVYNHVNISGVTAFYDLTNPIINRRDEAIVQDETDEQDKAQFGQVNTQGANGFVRMNSGPRKRRSSRPDAAADRSLLKYAEELLESCQDDIASDDDVPTDVEVATILAQKQRLQDLVRTSPSSMRSHLPLPATDTYSLKSQNTTRRRHGDVSQAGLGLSMEDDDLPKNSLQAVELLSRNSQKVSYDISKDGRVAAILTLVKSKYRLGDTVIGVVTINAADSIARVVRIAATLETHEEIESTLATLPAGRSHKITRTVHASFHDSTLDAGQACFSLPIPSGATPNFDTSAVRLAWTVRLAFLTLSNARQTNDADGSQRVRPAPHLIPGPDDGYAAYHRALRASPALAGPWTGQMLQQAGDLPPPEAKLEVVECAVPLTVLPHSTKFTVGEVAFVA